MSPDVIGGLIGLAGVLGVALIAIMRRNGNNGATSEDAVKQVIAALTREDVQRQALVNQEAMAGLLRQINETLREVRHDQGTLASTVATLAGHFQVMVETVKGLDQGQRDLVSIHGNMEELEKQRRDLERQVAERAALDSHSTPGVS